MSATRSLETRLTEYSTNLRSIADQLQNLVDQIEAARPDVNPETQEARDGIRLYRLIADDIDKILAGEELATFIVTGNLPTS